MKINLESRDFCTPQHEHKENLLQSEFWGSVKSRFGWGTLLLDLKIEHPGEDRSSKLLLLLKSLGLGFSLVYVPFGPSLDVPVDAFGEAIEAVSKKVTKYLPKSSVFIRYDLPNRVVSEGRFPGSTPAKFIKAVSDVQPPSTVILDLSLDENVLLSNMKSKTRYNIRLASKKGVKVREGNIDELEQWYDLYRETAQRDRITIHSLDYYKTLFTIENRREPVLKLLLAEVDNELLGGIIVAFYARTATYLYGAGSNKKRNLMPAYALQWEAIRLAKSYGCLTYDFFGIPPTDDPSHPMHGLYRFKVGFGGEIVHRPGCWDYPLRPVLYEMFRIAESMRQYYYKRLRKRGIIGNQG